MQTKLLCNFICVPNRSEAARREQAKRDNIYLKKTFIAPEGFA
jgi:hypothetical protein